LRTLIKGGRIIDPSAGIDEIGDVLVENGLIVATVKVNNFTVDEIIDAGNKIVCAGLVDMHCHMREPGQTHKEDIATGSKAAFRGGFTSVVAMPNTIPPVDNPDIIKDILKIPSTVNLYQAGAITRGQEGMIITDIAALKSAGAVAISDDGVPVENEEVLYQALITAQKQGIPVIYHSECLSVDGADAKAEWGDVERVLSIARRADAPIHITHISSETTVEIIRQAKLCGLKVTCDTCPHYFSLTRDAVKEYGTNAKMNPPLKDIADVNAIIGGLKDGTIDAISTDHAPHAVYEKNQDFEKAPNGIVGFETALGLGITKLVKAKHLTVNQLIQKMTYNPARLLGINAGTLKIGAPADILIFDLDKEYEVDVNSFAGKARNTPFNSWKLYGKVEKVICSNLK
jgi:dihydroorotase